MGEVWSEVARCGEDSGAAGLREGKGELRLEVGLEVMQGDCGSSGC